MLPVGSRCGGGCGSSGELLRKGVRWRNSGELLRGHFWVTVRFGRWAFGVNAGFYSGLALSTCIGLFLFTRILIPDAILTLAITVSMWAFLRCLDPDERRPRLWAMILAISLGAGLLLKGFYLGSFGSCEWVPIRKAVERRGAPRRPSSTFLALLALIYFDLP